MPDGIFGTGGWSRRGLAAALAGVLGVTFERATDEVARAQTHSESEREDDAAEEDAKGQLNDDSADLQMVERHGAGKHEHEPLDAKREKSRVLNLGVDGSDED